MEVCRSIEPSDILRYLPQYRTPFVLIIYKQGFSRGSLVWTSEN